MERSDAQKLHYERNRDALLEWQKQYDQEHAAEIKAKKRIYYLAHRDEILRAKRERYRMRGK